MFELLVNRSPDVGRTSYHQWIQKEDSVIITGVFIHVFKILDVYTAIPRGGSMSGWLRISDLSLRALQQLTYPPMSDETYAVLQNLRKRTFGED